MQQDTMQLQQVDPHTLLLPGRILIEFEFLFSPSFPGLYKRGWQTAYLQSESQEVPFLVDANISMMARSIINSPGAVASSS